MARKGWPKVATISEVHCITIVYNFKKYVLNIQDFLTLNRFSMIRKSTSKFKLHWFLYNIIPLYATYDSESYMDN